MEHLVLGLPVRSRLRRGAVPTIGVPVNVQPVTKMLVEDAKRSLLKVTHAKMLTDQKVIGNIGLADSKYQHHQPATERRQQQQHHHHQHQQRAKSGNQVYQEQKMAGIDVLLALGLKPAPRWVVFTPRLLVLDEEFEGKSGTGSDKILRSFLICLDYFRFSKF